MCIRDKYVVTFAVMLVIGVVISTLTSRLRAQIESTRQRERRTLTIYELGKQLSSLYGNVFLVGAAGGKIADCRVIEVLGDHSLCATDHRHPESEVPS